MAVDSAAKRASAHRAASWPGRVLPIPDGTVGAADRAHLAGFYGGLFAGDLVYIGPPPENVVYVIPRNWLVEL